MSTNSFGRTHRMLFTSGCTQAHRNVGRALLLALVAGIVAVPSNAYAYMDPGTGSMIYQTLLALLLGVGLLFHGLRTKIRAVLHRLFHRNPAGIESRDAQSGK